MYSGKASKITAIFLLMVMIIISMFATFDVAIAYSKADISYINSQAARHMYGIENYRSGDCYLSANVYMLRRRAFLDGMDWSGIKADTNPSQYNGGTGVRAVGAYDDKDNHNSMRLSYAYTYGSRTYRVNSANLIGSNDAKTETLCAQLDKHPEGIAVWGPMAAGYPHAVLLTHYTGDPKKKNVVFYAADSSHNTLSNNRAYGGWNSWNNMGVQKLSETTINTSSGQLAKITAYKYIESSKKIDKLAPAATSVWERLSGTGRYDTMQAIVEEGEWGYPRTVVIASGGTYKDALPASALAGIYNAPVLLTDGKSLSAQTKTLLQNLRPVRIFIAGGPFAVSDGVQTEIEALTKVEAQRVMGNTSSKTSAALAMAGKGNWSTDGTAIIATNKSFKDALSVAPIAYAKKYPILLADNGKNLDGDVIKALKDLNINNVIIVGETSAVTTDVEKQLVSNDIQIKTRLGGADGAATSAVIAKWGIDNGMTANNMGVATSQNFPDALAGAALCGSNNAILVLADDKVSKNSSFPKTYKTVIKRGYVFGGESAVGIKTWNELVSSVK